MSKTQECVRYCFPKKNLRTNHASSMSMMICFQLPSLQLARDRAEQSKEKLEEMEALWKLKAESKDGRMGTTVQMQHCSRLGSVG